MSFITFFVGRHGKRCLLPFPSQPDFTWIQNHHHQRPADPVFRPSGALGAVQFPGNTGGLTTWPPRNDKQMETTDEIYSALANGLETGGVRPDVAAILRGTIFSGVDANNAVAIALDRLIALPEESK